MVLGAQESQERRERERLDYAHERARAGHFERHGWSRSGGKGRSGLRLRPTVYNHIHIGNARAPLSGTWP